MPDRRSADLCIGVGHGPLPFGRSMRNVEWIVSEEPVEYNAATEFMASRAEAVRSGEWKECVWLLEHPPLYTGGTGAVPGELLDAQAFPVHETGRGGRYTYHGPGQRIAYVVLDLSRRGSDVRKFVWSLEEWVIRALADLGVAGERRDGRIGVWVNGNGGDAKIAALGLRLRHWVSTHGVAINVDPDLAHFKGIVPCGIRDHGVTSLRAMGISAGMRRLDAALWRHFEGVLGSKEE